MDSQGYIQFHEKFCADMVAITKKKNHDYAGAGNDPFRNFRQIGSLVGNNISNAKGTGPLDIVAVGFLTRMSDKLSRIGTFVANGELLVKDESVDDTLKDLSNYCALMCGYLESERQALRNVQATTKA